MMFVQATPMRWIDGMITVLAADRMSDLVALASDISAELDGRAIFD